MTDKIQRYREKLGGVYDYDQGCYLRGAGVIVGRLNAHIKAIEAAKWEAKGNLHALKCANNDLRIEAKKSKKLRQTIQDQAKQIEKLKEGIGWVIDDDPCRFDHNNNCQEHCCFEGNGKCYMADLKELTE